MDFSALQQGVITAVVAVASITFSIPPAAPQDEVSLTDPEIISSYNLPKETAEPQSLQNLNSLMTPITDELRMVVREAKASEVSTVEQPPVVFTVFEPTPKPSPVAKIAQAVEEKSGEVNDDTNIPKPEASKKPAAKTEDKKDTPKPSPLATTSPSSSPAASPVTAAASSGSNADILFQMTNDHRAKIGKPAFEKDERLCKIAESRAPQVNGELASGSLHKGFKALNLPYWATENLAAYQTMAENFRFLVTDYIHRVAIESDHKYSCTACSGTSCSQIFSSFVPK